MISARLSPPLLRLRTPRSLVRASLPCSLARTGSTSTATRPKQQQQKRAGDISDAFVSLSGQNFKPLEPRYAALKKRLIRGREGAIADSWIRLLRRLRDETQEIAQLGSAAVPEVEFKDVQDGRLSEEFRKAVEKRGVSVIRGVLPEKEALGLKQDLRDYIRNNPHTKAFPADNPQVYELYWSPSQMRARAHPNLLQTQRLLMEFWHSKTPDALISCSHPTAYADRIRIRQPGDAKFALGPHVDGGSVERWEEDGYGRGKVYDAVFEGKWEEFSPWEASCRLDVVSDMYQGVGACSMLRLFQGWLSMSETGPFEGTLKVNPLLGVATSYYLLRPFFTPKRPASEFGGSGGGQSAAFLDPANWIMEPDPTSWVQGATPGHGQELAASLHPHLDLERSMVHVPRVQPGDYVAWHCDTIHAVDNVHAGTADSSVLYIPSCPLTESNAKFLLRQREAFVQGIPCPDFGGGEGESRHVGRPTAADVARTADADGLRAFGLQEWDADEPGLSPGQREVLNRANKTLGFYT
ncbi:hypothetical protein BDY21DRAFT_352424 [Lineolata rhizophorae]|uniref:DUF1479-domain-containing protein n=1 Tax=Lineolata rhizophorae TaxID=578093 RepID=A0A6A6NSH9_9PEZI|nr:hypothetical protein BDY21DRAFT_352424 [Lineolata rhizophorae]